MERLPELEVSRVEKTQQMVRDLASAKFINESMQDKKRRREENGRIIPLVPQSFCVIFEFDPIWLLALRPYFVSQIYIL